VIAVSKDGVKVEVQGIEGEIPASELAVEKINKPEDYFSVGDQVNALVTEVSREQWALKLSIRRILERAERASYEQYLEEDEESQNPKLGDLFAEKLQKGKKK
jgi:small subunit ribosomal protein S1